MAALLKPTLLQRQFKHFHLIYIALRLDGLVNSKSHHFYVMARRTCPRISLQSLSISLEGNLSKKGGVSDTTLFSILSYCPSSIQKLFGIADFPPPFHPIDSIPSDLGPGIANFPSPFHRTGSFPSDPGSGIAD